MNKGGRPTINKEETLHYLKEAFWLDSTVEIACQYAGICKSTFYNYCSSDRGFLDEINRARIYPFLVAKGAVVGAMELGDTQTALRYLRLRDNRHKESYA